VGAMAGPAVAPWACGALRANKTGTRPGAPSTNSAPRSSTSLAVAGRATPGTGITSIWGYPLNWSKPGRPLSTAGSLGTLQTPVADPSVQGCWRDASSAGWGTARDYGRPRPLLRLSGYPQNQHFPGFPGEDLLGAAVGPLKVGAGRRSFSEPQLPYRLVSIGRRPDE